MNEFNYLAYSICNLFKKIMKYKILHKYFTKIYVCTDTPAEELPSDRDFCATVICPNGLVCRVEYCESYCEDLDCTVYIIPCAGMCFPEILF